MVEGWYNTNWSYRIPITINSSTSLTDYQIKVVIDSSHSDFWNHVQPDARDVRFTDSDGLSYLPYWIEKWDHTNKKATIWVKVPNIPNGTKTIYLYYGNPNATGIGFHHDPDHPNNTSKGWYAGDGDNTFIFFDDFEEGALNGGRWEETKIGNSTIEVVNYQIHLVADPNSNEYARIISKTSINTLITLIISCGR